ncbi:MAG: long-chain fatty acid--CoA ligase, partial [Firmicutes bacterium]|nr:long-chain fatty acid--CoA ligase [Bacillota bacterium]
MTQFKENNIAAVFQNNAAKYGEKAYAMYRKGGEGRPYIDISWSEMNEMVKDLSYYLISLGVKKGDRVAIFSDNRYEWHVSALAINSCGAIDVPIYATNSTEEAEYILVDSGAKICLSGSVDQLERVLKSRNSLPDLIDYVVFDEYSGDAEGVKTFSQALTEGKANPAEDEFVDRLKSILPDDLSTLLYTSGTTGDPKGVMLTHNNLYSNVENTLHDMVDRKTGRPLLNEDDLFLSFLPLSHSLERTAGFHGALTRGAKTAFAVNINTLLDDFVEVRPTIIISVPRIYEKVHAGILSNISNSSALKKIFFNFATKQARLNIDKVCKDQEITSFKYKLADKLVFSTLKETLGMDRLRFAISGGAPLSLDDCEFFVGMGFKILEGFGLTETSPITHFNRPWSMKPGTVGMPIKDTEAKVSDEGEILIKGPQVMAGYYKNEEATEEVMTPDGFFKTGDMGEIDNEGFLKITGRIKDIIVTAGGKNISPQNIENSVKGSRFVEQIAIIGDKRRFLSALIVPAFPELEAWAKQQGISFA